MSIRTHPPRPLRLMQLQTRLVKTVMADIQNVRMLYLKGFLLLLLGCLASALLLVLVPSLRVAALLAVAVWSFCRAYYFAFYVIEHYVEREFRFTGLIDFARYALRRRFGSGGG